MKEAVRNFALLKSHLKKYGKVMCCLCSAMSVIKFFDELINGYRVPKELIK
jgi:hypothetical protein